MKARPCALIVSGNSGFVNRGGGGKVEKWDRNANGTIRRNSPINARLAFEEIGWADLSGPDKYDRAKIVDRIEEKCGYRPTGRVVQRVIEDRVLLL